MTEETWTGQQNPKPLPLWATGWAWSLHSIPALVSLATKLLLGWSSCRYRSCWRWLLLLLRRQGLQNCVHFFCNGHQYKFELLFRLHHVRTLVANVLQGRCDVDLLSTLSHAIQDHVDKTVRAGATNPITETNVSISVLAILWAPKILYPCICLIVTGQCSAPSNYTPI